MQATDTFDESRFLLEIASRTSFVAGVVGWWDARGARSLDALRDLPHAGRLVGVRPMLQKYEDVSWLLDAGNLRAVARLAETGLVFDALIDARHLDVVHGLASALPELRIAVNHMAKPWRWPDRLDTWRKGMRALADVPNCWVKISGFPFGAHRPAAARGFAELAGMLTDWFGPDRLVWGSDWPVAQRECSYAAALSVALAQFGGREAEHVFAGNAWRLYNLEPAGGGK